MSLEPDPVRRLRASAHPVRLRILSLLTSAELSAAEVARELDLTQANASYHLRTLADVGLIEVRGTEKVRGGVAKKYRYTVESAEAAGKKRPSAEDAAESFPMVATALASELQRRSRSYRPDGEDGPDNMYADLETWIDAETWQQVVDLVVEASRLAHQGARPPRTEGTFPVSFVASLFRMRAAEESWS